MIYEFRKTLLARIKDELDLVKDDWAMGGYSDEKEAVKKQQYAQALFFLMDLVDEVANDMGLDEDEL